LEIIASDLAKRGQPASAIEKVLGANFERVIGEISGDKRRCVFERRSAANSQFLWAKRPVVADGLGVELAVTSASA
jgi:hypothetical protein